MRFQENRKSWAAWQATVVLSVGLVLIIPAVFSSAGNSKDEDVYLADSCPIFPGQCEPEVCAAILRAYHAALERDYEEAKRICRDLGKRFPENPAGPAGETVLYQVMMLENDDYNLDKVWRDASRRALAAASRYQRTAAKNDWFYTLLGATWGIQGIYHLRRDEYLPALYYGIKGLYYMQTAASMSRENYEARMGIGLFLYYRSAYASFLPLPWLDRREEGIAMVKEAGEKRTYLSEVSRIALFYIYLNEKEYDRAFAYMDALIRERPYFPVFYQLAGRALMEAGDYAGAYAYYDRMRQVDPDLYLPYFKLGECAYHLGRKEEAGKWFAKFFEVLGERESIHRKPAEKYLEKIRG